MHIHSFTQRIYIESIPQAGILFIVHWSNICNCKTWRTANCPNKRDGVNTQRSFFSAGKKKKRKWLCTEMEWFPGYISELIKARDREI